MTVKNKTTGKTPPTAVMTSYLVPQVKGSIVKASPYTACGSLDNAGQLRGHIALVLRGDCMFAAKARRLQEAGAVGVIFIGDQRTPGRGGQNDL